MHLLSPAIFVQPVRRSGMVHAAARQSRQRQVLAESATAGDRALSPCDIPKFFRGDAAFANPAIYRLLEEAGYRYAIRLKANAALEREIEPWLKRPAGRPSHRPKVFYHSFQYQAKPWQHPRRVVAKIEWHRGELFPRVGFIVT